MSIDAHNAKLERNRELDTGLTGEGWVLEYTPLSQTPDGRPRRVTGTERSLLKLRRELREVGVTQIRFAKAERLNKKGELPILRHRFNKNCGKRDATSVARDYLDWAISKGLTQVHVFAAPSTGKSNAGVCADLARRTSLNVVEVDPNDYK